MDLFKIIERGKRYKRAKPDVLAFIGVRDRPRWYFRLRLGGLGVGPDKASKIALHYVRPKMRARIAETAGFKFGWVITKYKGNTTEYGKEKQST